MKRFICLLLLTLGMLACYEESPIHVEEGEPRYNLQDDPSDPVQHYVYEFYKNYRTIILTNPTLYDYKFNFSMKNRVDIIAPEQDKELLYEGIGFIEDVFINIYTPEFRRNYFPMLIIMADTIRDAGFGSTEMRNSVSSTNFVAIGNIRPGFIDALTEEEIVAIRAEINGNFWADYMTKAKGFFIVDSAFYRVSAEDYGEVVIGFFDDKDVSEIDFYEMGFISYDPESSWIEPGFTQVQNPTEAIDLSQWLNFIFLKTPDEMRQICEQYPKMKEKYEVLREGIMACSGFDIAKIGSE